MDWPSSLTDFETHLRLERNLADNSVQAYLRDVSHLRRYAENVGVEPEDVTPQLLREVVAELVEAHVETTTQCRIISGWRAFYRMLLANEVVQRNPADEVEMPGRGKHLPDVLSDAEIAAMQATLQLGLPGRFRNYVIIEILYGCGLRVSELVNLKLSNIYADEQMLQVIGKGNKERWVPINAHALKLLQDYILYDRSKLEIQHGEELYVFLNLHGHRLTRIAVFQFIKQAALDAGIKKTVSPHSLRHSFATELVQNGADLRAVQEMLGHESLVTTEIYTHLSRQYLRDTISTYHPHYKK